MSSTKQVYLVTGGGSGFGALSARALALEGHTVFATVHSQGAAEAAAAQFAVENNCDLRTVQLDLREQVSVDNCVAHILAATGNQLDVVVHNAGHMNYGPSEAFTAEQLMNLYDINTVGMHRLNTTVLPYFRARKSGHIIYISSSSAYGGKSPFLGGYFAAKAGMDVLAQVYAVELRPWGIETTIIVPGVFGGTDHFKNAMQPGRPEVAEAYDAVDAPTHGMAKQNMDGLLEILPKDPTQADPKLVADELVRVSRFPAGQKPYRTFVDPVRDGCEEGATLVDENAMKFCKRVGLTPYL